MQRADLQEYIKLMILHLFLQIAGQAGNDRRKGRNHRTSGRQ